MKLPRACCDDGGDSDGDANEQNDEGGELEPPALAVAGIFDDQNWSRHVRDARCHQLQYLCRSFQPCPAPSAPAPLPLPPAVPVVLDHPNTHVGPQLAGPAQQAAPGPARPTAAARASALRNPASATERPGLHSLLRPPLPPDRMAEIRTRQKRVGD